MTVELPSSTAEVLAWSWLVLLWVLSQYAPIPSWPAQLQEWPEHVVRGVGAAAAAVLVAAGDAQGVVLVLLSTVPLGVVFSSGRVWAAAKGHTVAWELGIPTLFLLASAIVVAEVSPGTLELLPEVGGGTALRDLLILLAAIVYSWSGGSRVVAGVLDRLSIPTGDDEGLIAPASLSRGELIGKLERLLLIVLVVEGAFTALAFLIAAKGFVRSKEFDDNREFAEYFLVGTFVSLTMGLAIGLGVAAVI